MGDWVYRQPYRRPPQQQRWIIDTVAVPVIVTPDAASLTLTTFTPSIIVGLPFPTTGQLDNFNRTDGALGANWGGNLFEADGTLTIDGNAVRGASPTINNNQGWIGQFGPDCEVWVEIPSGTSSEFSTFIAARWSELGSDAPDGYAVRARGGDTNNLFLMRFDNGALTGLAVIVQEVDDGDWLGLRVVGDRLDVYFKDASGTNQWTWAGGATDGTYSAAGHIGLLLTSDTIKADNFGGGTLGSVTVEPGPATLTLTGFAPVLRLATTPIVALLALSTFTPTVTVVVTVTPDSASLSLTTFTPTVTATANVSVTPAPATLSLTTFAAALQLTVTPAAQSFTLTTFAPALVITVTPAAATLTTTGFAPALHERLTPSPTTLTLTTFAPEITISADITVTPTTASLTLTTFAPDVIAEGDVVLTPNTTVLTLVTFAPILREAITPASSTLTLATFAPVLAQLITPAPASLALITFTPTVTTGVAGAVTVTPATASLALTGYAPWLFTGLVPANRTYMVNSGQYEVVVSAGDYEFLDDYEDDEVFVS